MTPYKESPSNLLEVNIHIPPFRAHAKPLRYNDAETMEKQDLSHVLPTTITLRLENCATAVTRPNISPAIQENLPFLRPKRRTSYKHFYWSKRGQGDGRGREKE